MDETVDQAQTRPPRALAGIIEDAWRATGGHCWADGPAWACSHSAGRSTRECDAQVAVAFGVEPGTADADTSPFAASSRTAPGSRSSGSPEPPPPCQDTRAHRPGHRDRGRLGSDPLPVERLGDGDAGDH